MTTIEGVSVVGGYISLNGEVFTRYVGCRFERVQFNVDEDVSQVTFIACEFKDCTGTEFLSRNLVVEVKLGE